MPIIHVEGFWNLPVNPARRVPGFMKGGKADNEHSNPRFYFPSPLNSQHLHFQFTVASLSKIFVRSRRDWEKKCRVGTRQSDNELDTDNLATFLFKKGVGHSLWDKDKRIGGGGGGRGGEGWKVRRGCHRNQLQLIHTGVTTLTAHGHCWWALTVEITIDKQLAIYLISASAQTTVYLKGNLFYTYILSLLFNRASSAASLCRSCWDWSHHDYCNVCIGSQTYPLSSICVTGRMLTVFVDKWSNLSKDDLNLFIYFCYLKDYSFFCSYTASIYILAWTKDHGPYTEAKL